ncbi:hypothetical protein [Piscinibacter defluvii]|uniref:hypothetical protein n=1 Tax=Piscinibacter defluvii TaxID=1796922 RepID=UPI000FDD9B5C|nr:hypothetical protein [Piscinibacter defluvii]
MNQALRAVATGQAQPREADDFGSLLNRGFTPFSPDAWHVMQARDEQLIEDELLRGAVSKAFVYDFTISGNRVTGVSVVGARQLASEYGGIKSKIVATVEKRGALFIFRSFEPLSIHTAVLPELEADTDFYECVMQVDDIKTGNSTQVRKKETKIEKKRDGGLFERPHFDVIAESKARRNGILDVLPQKVIEDFKKKHLAAGNASQEKTIDQLRSGAQQFAAKHGIGLDRRVLDSLSYAELMGLGGAAAGGVDQFRASAESLKLVASATGEVPPPAPPAGGKAAARRAATKEAPEPAAAAQAAAAPRSAPGGPNSAAAAPTSAPSYAAVAEAISRAGNRDDALAELDAARDLPADQQRDLKAHLERTYPAEG